MSPLAHKRAVDRDRRIRALMPERAHFENCPALDGAGRMEAYDVHQPPQPGKNNPPRDILVVRCIECGGSKVHENGTVATLIDRPARQGMADGGGGR